jgi:hypothetical protein
VRDRAARFCARDRPRNRAVAHPTCYVSPDGYLMPIKKNQAPPDLRYFKQPQK